MGWLYKAQALLRRAPVLHTDSMTLQGPDPIVQLMLTRGRASTGLLFFFTFQIPQRLCVPVLEGQRRGRLFGMQSATPLPLGPCIELILQTLPEFTGCLFQMGGEKEAKKVTWKGYVFTSLKMSYKAYCDTALYSKPHLLKTYNSTIFKWFVFIIYL